MKINYLTPHPKGEGYKYPKTSTMMFIRRDIKAKSEQSAFGKRLKT